MTISGLLTPLCQPVHPAWVDANTTPIATSMAVLQTEGGSLVLVRPCEVTVEGEPYPALGLSVEECDSSALRWSVAGKNYSMSPLSQAEGILPFSVSRIVESDPLDEGPVSEILLMAKDGSQLLFRHIMPPMTLGIAVTEPDQSSNNSFKVTPDGAPHLNR